MSLFALLFTCLICLSSEASWREFASESGEPLCLQHDANGSYLCDAEGALLVTDATENYQFIQGGTNGLRSFNPSSPYYYAEEDSQGEVLASTKMFPDPGNVLDPGILQHMRLRDQATLFTSSPVLPLSGDIELCVVPIRLYESIGDSMIWEDENYYLHNSQSTSQEFIYTELFSPTQSELLSPAEFDLGVNLPEYWSMQQDSIVSHIVPDQERCSWYGEFSGWATNPQGDPWSVNIRVLQNWQNFFGFLQSQGLDLSNRDAHHPVLFLLSGDHIAGHQLSYPGGGFGLCNLWYRISSEIQVVYDQIPIGFVCKTILQISANLRDTSFDPLAITSKGSSVWDIMAEGETGYSQLLHSHIIHFPGPLNPIDRIRLGWAQNAVEYSYSYIPEPQQNFDLDADLVYIRSPYDPAEMIAFSAWSIAPDSPYRYYQPSVGTNGRGLAYTSHGAERLGLWGYERVPEVIRSELLELAPGSWDESRAPYPSEANDLLNQTQWSTTENLNLLFNYSNSSGMQLHSVVPVDTSGNAHMGIVDLPASREVPLNLAGDFIVPFINLGVQINAFNVHVDNSPAYLVDPFNGYFSSIPAGTNLTPMVINYFHFPADSLSLPTGQEFLGAAWDMDFNMRYETGSYSFETLPFSTRFGPPVHDQIPLTDPDWSSVSTSTTLVLQQNNRLDVYSDNMNLLGTIDPDSEILDFYPAQITGGTQSAEELIVVTQHQATVFNMSPSNTPVSIAGWPVTLSDPGPSMCVKDPQLDSAPVLVFVDGSRLELLRADGQQLNETRATIDIPASVLPVTQMAYAGGDSKGPRFLLVGGPSGDPAMVLLDQESQVLLEYDPMEVTGLYSQWKQVLCSDFLNNGYIDCAIVVTQEQPGSQPDRNYLFMIAWSEQHQEWGLSVNGFAQSTLEGHGPEEILPLRGNDPYSSTRLIFNNMDLVSYDGVDQGGLRIADLSDPLWNYRITELNLSESNNSKYLMLVDLDNDGQQDLVNLSRGLGLDAFMGDQENFTSMNNDGRIHYSNATARPVPAMINGSLHVGLEEAGELIFYDMLSPNWPSWHNPKGPGNAGWLPNLTIGSLAVPELSLHISQMRPVLRFDPVTPPVTSVMILESAQVFGQFNLLEEIPWDGQTHFEWSDESMLNIGVNRNYRVKLKFEYPGPDGAVIHD